MNNALIKTVAVKTSLRGKYLENLIQLVENAFELGLLPKVGEVFELKGIRNNENFVVDFRYLIHNITYHSNIKYPHHVYIEVSLLEMV